MIEELNSIGNNDYLRQVSDSKKSAEEKKTEKAGSSNGSVKSSDKLNISDEAKQALELKEFTKIAKASPDIREDVVAQAKNDLENGTLDDESALEATADKLISEYI